MNYWTCSIATSIYISNQPSAAPDAALFHIYRPTGQHTPESSRISQSLALYLKAPSSRSCATSTRVSKSGSWTNPRCKCSKGSHQVSKTPARHHRCKETNCQPKRRRHYASLSIQDFGLEIHNASCSWWMLMRHPAGMSWLKLSQTIYCTFVVSDWPILSCVPWSSEFALPRGKSSAWSTGHWSP